MAATLTDLTEDCLNHLLYYLPVDTIRAFIFAPPLRNRQLRQAVVNLFARPGLTLKPPLFDCTLPIETHNKLEVARIKRPELFCESPLFDLVKRIELPGSFRAETGQLYGADAWLKLVLQLPNVEAVSITAPVLDLHRFTAVGSDLFPNLRAISILALPSLGQLGDILEMAGQAHGLTTLEISAGWLLRAFLERLPGTMNALTELTVWSDADEMQTCQQTIERIGGANLGKLSYLQFACKGHRLRTGEYRCIRNFSSLRALPNLSKMMLYLYHERCFDPRYLKQQPGAVEPLSLHELNVTVGAPCPIEGLSTMFAQFVDLKIVRIAVMQRDWQAFNALPLIDVLANAKRLEHFTVVTNSQSRPAFCDGAAKPLADAIQRSASLVGVDVSSFVFRHDPEEAIKSILCAAQACATVRQIEIAARMDSIISLHRVMPAGCRIGAIAEAPRDCDEETNAALRPLQVTIFGEKTCADCAPNFASKFSVTIRCFD